ncbi:hypothetical protein Vafri_2388 [Volvox africanus]|nr:hypothetical protein Vafri_2388 [Volvox africanus]
MIQGLQQEISNTQSEATARVADHELQMQQAVAESARQHAQREGAFMQERIEQLQTALNTSRSEAEQARDENKRLAAQMASTRQLLAVAETEAHELRWQLGEKLMVAKKEAGEMHSNSFNSEVRLAMRAEIEIEEETLRLVRAGNIRAAMQLQAKKKTVQLWRVKADGSVLEWGTTEEDSEDGVMLRAQCGALRRELKSIRPKLGSMMQAFEAAAQFQPAETMVEARAPADTGRVENAVQAAAVDSATEAVQQELTVTVLKLQAQSAAATAQAHEMIQGLQQEISNTQSEATARVADHELQMQQAVAESARQHAQREERIEQLQTALNTSRSEAEQARDENKRLAAQMASTQQPLAVAETEAHELRWQLGEKLMVTKKEAGETHSDYFTSDVRLAMRAEIEIEKETLRLVRAGNIKAAMQLQAKKKTVQLWRVKADGAVSVESRPIGPPVGSLADELVDIYSKYQIPAMPKYEFSNLC